MNQEFNILCSYTLESSFCGAENGKYGNCHFTPNQLQQAGKLFCVSLKQYHKEMNLAGPITKERIKDMEKNKTTKCVPFKQLGSKRTYDRRSSSSIKSGPKSLMFSKGK